jgi:hypothetical protein
MNARAEILASVRSAIADLPAGSGEVPRNYAFTLPMTDVLGTFVQRVADYRAEVERVPADELAQRITAAVAGWGGGTVVVPPDLDAGWVEAIAAAADVGSDVPPLTLDELDHSAGVVTSAALGIALTGTLVLDAGVGMGRRALSRPRPAPVHHPGRRCRRQRARGDPAHRPHPTGDLHQRTVGHQRHRAQPRRRRARAPHPARHRRRVSGRRVSPAHDHASARCTAMPPGVRAKRTQARELTTWSAVPSASRGCVVVSPTV